MDWDGVLQDFLRDLIGFIPRLIAALVIFVATLIFSALVARWVKRAGRAKIKDPETLHALSLLFRWGILVVGTIVALDQMNFDVTGFLAGLGVLGFTVGFAMQDIARNFVAGILLLIQQPFDIGDAVKVGEFTGKVVDIRLRDTVIQTWDGELVIVPNIEVYTRPIVNYSDLPLRRRTIRVRVGYDEDIGRAAKVFLETVRGVDGVLADPAPTVMVEGLGDSAVELAIRFWLNQETHSLIQVHSQAVQAIKEAAEAEGIDLPYPTQTIRVEGAVPQG
ncbi:MAG TPA: mechanosensitive ion channel [Chloroflexi bacterium]|nr:mechanosensitive ion channel [Chloroflexota bacterium]